MNKKKKKRKHINSKRNECSSLVIWFGWWFWVHFQRFTERWCLQLKMKREQEVFGCHNISHGKVYCHFSVKNHSNIPFLWILTCQRRIKQSSTEIDMSNTEAPFIKEAKTRHHAFSRCQKTCTHIFLCWLPYTALAVFEMFFWIYSTYVLCRGICESAMIWVIPETSK